MAMKTHQPKVESPAPRSPHEARKFEWNNAIMQQLKDAERLAGRKLTLKDMLPVATRLMAQYQFSGAFEKYKGAGK